MGKLDMERRIQLRRKKMLSALVKERHDGYGRGGLARLASELDLSSGYISQLLKLEGDGSRPITEKTAISIEQKLGLEDGWFDGQEVRRGHPAPPPKSKDVLLIPQLDVAAAMGTGMIRPDGHIDVIEQLSVNREWLRRNVTCTSPGNLALITAYGDSMQGTFNDGDILMVDRGVHDIKLDAVYVLSLNDELFIKRLQRRPDGTILMLSDNPRYPPYEINNGDIAAFSVLGRVLLAWNVRRL